MGIKLLKLQATPYPYFAWALSTGVSQVALVVKKLPQRRRLKRWGGLIPGLGRSHGGGNSSPLQYSCLENTMGGLQSIASQRVGQD